MRHKQPVATIFLLFWSVVTPLHDVLLTGHVDPKKSGTEGALHHFFPPFPRADNLWWALTSFFESIFLSAVYSN